MLIIIEAKNAQFFVYKRTGFVHPRLRDFVKLTRVSSHWLWLESSRDILRKMWLEWSPSHQKSWLKSSRVIDSSQAITGAK